MMDMKATAAGAARSKTVYLGLAVMVLGYLQANIGVIAPYVKPEILGLANVAIGTAIIITRFFTDQSLADKVSK